MIKKVESFPCVLLWVSFTISENKKKKKEKYYLTGAFFICFRLQMGISKFISFN